MRTIIKLKNTDITPVRRKRVAAYARVSSGKDAMLHSLSAQISYYNSYIGNRGDWELAGIYADEALTGTKEERPEFQRLLMDCRDGKIDMVITKSLTRFARNTVTLLATVRELKALGVDVYFEKENIHTLSSDGELMLTLLASFAQEESRSVSENLKWRIRKMFEAGRPNTGRMLGYRLKDGVLRVVPEEAAVVKMIYADFLSGMGRNLIIKKLNRMGIPTMYGGPWRESTLYHILTNEKYTGNMLLQKTYHTDHIEKKKRINHGELPMYYVENSHEAIIDKEAFERVQRKIRQRAELYPSAPGPKEKHLFTGLLHCGICGRPYRRKVTAMGTKYAKPIWICWTFFTLGKNFCHSQRIAESILIARTSEVLGSVDWDRDVLLEHISEIRALENHRLLYVFRDGHTREVAWQNPSRRESWTAEMKQRARERQLKIVERRREDGRTC